MSRHNEDPIIEMLKRMPRYRLPDEMINEQIKVISKRINRKTFRVIRGLQIGAFTIAVLALIILVPFMATVGNHQKSTQANLNGSPQNNQELIKSEGEKEAEEKQNGVLDRRTIHKEYEKEFNSLPSKVKIYINSIEVYINLFNEDPSFRERLAMATEMIPNLNENDVDALSYPIAPPEPEYQREANKIKINSPVFEEVYHEFNAHEMDGNKTKILNGLARIGSEFYLRKDGQVVSPDGIEDFGKAKEWSTFSAHEDFEKVSDNVIADSKDKLKIVEDILSLVQKYDMPRLTRLLEWAESELTMIVNKGKVITQEDYGHYFSTGRDLFILNNVLNQPLPVDFVKGNELSNREIVEYLAEMKQKEND